MKPKQLIAAALAAALLTVPAATVQAREGAPIAENMELDTYRGIAVDGQLRATDPEGDALTYQITTPPVKGQIAVAEDGSFTYTPAEKKRGKDYFGYTATDSHGNVSQEATVIITLRKQKTDVIYSDMTDSPLHRDAIRLAEEGIFTGQQLGGGYVFSPDTMISRGEFLTMCMTVSDLPILSAVTDTGYADDAGIPHWQKPYIATALMYGTFGTVSESSTTDFNATAPITCAEAAVMIDGIFNLSTVPAASMDGSSPDQTAQAVANLIACRVLPEHCDTAQYLNRSMTADILNNLIDVLEQR